MALSGAHIVCAYYGLPFNDLPFPQLLSSLAWSQTMANGGTTTNAAPARATTFGQIIFEVYSSADIYVSYGVAPDATNGPRVFVPAATTCDYLVQPGDKLAWILA